MLTNMIL